MRPGEDLRAVLAGGEAHTRGVLHDALRRVGFEVSEVQDGQAALEAATSGQNQLIITARALPGLDGFALCRQLRTAVAGRSVHVIMLLAHADLQSVAAALEAGADDILFQPVEPAELQARLAVAGKVLGLEEQLARQQRRLDELNSIMAERASIDPLMGIGNRRSFEQTIS